jgi:GTPase involved in cell partitioning and DNA repair
LETKVFGLYFTLNCKDISKLEMAEMEVATSQQVDGDDKYIEVPLGTVVKIKETEKFYSKLRR